MKAACGGMSLSLSVSGKSVLSSIKKSDTGVGITLPANLAGRSGRTPALPYPPVE